jgi:hypothetical protein
MRVFLTKDLKEALGPVGPKLVADFKEWKQLPDPCDHFVFGRLTPEKMAPIHDIDVIWHVHLLPPEDSPDYAEWVRKWNHKDPRFKRARCNRTSDVLLFYTQHELDYLLLTIGRHADFGNRKFQDAWASVADRWVASIKR